MYTNTEVGEDCWIYLTLPARNVNNIDNGDLTPDSMLYSNWYYFYAYISCPSCGFTNYGIAS
jgi:hypothetical protein